MLLETRCGACGRIGPSPCPACTDHLHRCGPVPLPHGFDRCRALLEFTGTARDLIARIKYRNERAALDWLAVGMADLVPIGGIDVVTWAPTSDRRRRERGFDHAELLARRVARRIGSSARSLLRHGQGPALTGLDAEARRRAAGFSPTRRLAGATVLVVDDVITTGATLEAAGSALRLAGAGALVGVAAAHRP